MTQSGSTGRIPVAARQRLGRLLARPHGAGPYVTSIVAPVGYDKTLLLEAMRNSNPDDSGFVGLYLRLPDAEHQAKLFLNLLVAEIRAQIPGARVSGLVKLKSVEPDDGFGERLAYVLARLLEGSDVQNAVMLFDDFQGLGAGEVLTSLIRDLVRACPARVRFVFASRTQLPFYLPEVVGEGDLLELTASDLALTREECVGALRPHLPDTLHPLLPVLWERTRGWPAVLRMLGGMMTDQDYGEATELLEGLGGRDEAAMAFVVQQMLSQQSPQTQYLMKLLSVLERIEMGAVDSIVRPAGPRAGKPGQGARAVIALDSEEIHAQVVHLHEAQILVAAGSSGEGLEFNPLVRSALSQLFQETNPDGFREAHRLAAKWHLSRTETPTVVAVNHAMAAGSFDQVLDLLEEAAEHFFDRGRHRALNDWLEALEEHYGSLPFWGSYYLGRLATALGDWDRARVYLDRCKRQLPGRQAAGDMWRWHPHLSLAHAWLYWRRGLHAHARTYCQRALDFLRQARRRGQIPSEGEIEVVRLKLQLLDLLGTAKLEIGAYEQASHVFGEARALASEHGLRVHEAVALSNLGLITSRLGQISEAIEILSWAVDMADAEDDADLYARSVYLLGFAMVMGGEFEEGLARLIEAYECVVHTGRPGTIAHILTMLGRIYGGVGLLDEADDAFGRALHVVAPSGEIRVRAEVLNNYAIILANSGRIEEARLVLQQAAALVDGRLRADAHAVATHGEAQACYEAARGNFEKAQNHLKRTLDRFERLGAAYQVARLTWCGAVWRHTAFVQGKESTPETALSEMEKACAAGVSRGYSFEAGRGSVQLLHVGLAYGDGDVQVYCRDMLERLELPTEDLGANRGLPQDVADRYRDYRRRAELDDDYAITSRDGTVGANARQVNQLVEDHGDECLMLLVHEQVLVQAGEEISLAEKRVIMPLILHFLRAPDGAFTMQELAEQVWGATDGSAMQTKVKVAVSRLRALLGKDRPYVLTTKVDRGGDRPVVAYALAKDLPFYLVERAVPQP